MPANNVTKRPVKVEVKMTIMEKRSLRLLAQRVGLTISEYVRRKVKA